MNQYIYKMVDSHELILQSNMHASSHHSFHLGMGLRDGWTRVGPIGAHSF